MKRGYLVGLAALLQCLGASANGRFPLAQQLVVAPKDPNSLALRSTFGLVLSKDGGKNWHWVCEQAIGYSGVEDPALGVTQGGALIAGIFDGLRRGDPKGCDFTFPDPQLKDRYAVDVTVDKTDPRIVYVLTSTGKGGGNFETLLWRSSDEGVTFNQLGSALPEAFLGLTLDPAPSDPNRIYVSGLGSGSAGLLYATNDAGQSWQSFTVPSADIQNSPFIGAVSPTDPLRVYLRIAGSQTNRLLLTDDGGQSFTEIFAGTGRMLGFALSPSGDEVTIGYGDPKGGAVVDPQTLGLWHAKTSDHVFTRVHEGPVNCLTWTSQSLYVCGSQFEQGFELGRVDAPSLGGGSVDFTPVFRLDDVQGPAPCPSGSGTESLCTSAWPALCELLGRCTDAGSGGADGGDAGPDAPPAPEPGDCNCIAVGRRVRLPSWIFAIPLAFLLGRRRRHR
ncbi:MAG: hypothetical protein R3B13_29015 [Polyangiaceae bacterium]